MTIDADVLHERAIELQRVDGKPAKIVETGVAGTEIVDGQGEPQILQPRQRALSGADVLDQAGLRQLQLDGGGIDGVFDAQPLQIVAEAGVENLPRRHVDGDLSRAPAAALPGDAVAEHGFRHPAAEGDDLPAVFGDADELAGRDDRSAAAPPAHQRFGTGHDAVVQAVLGLVENQELSVVQRPAHVLRHLVLVNDLPVHALGEELEVVAAGVLRLIHGDVGVLDERFRVTAVVGKDGDADAHRGAHLMALDQIRFGEGGGELAGDRFGRGDVIQILQQHRELVAAEPGDDVAVAHGVADAPTGGDQQPIAELVTRACRSPP